MGTVTIINRSTLTDGAAVARIGLYMQGKREAAQTGGIYISQVSIAGYGDKQKFFVTEGAHG